MRCHICDRGLNKPTYNRSFEDFDPCPTCLEIIQDVFNDGEYEVVEDREPTDEELLQIEENES